MTKYTIEYTEGSPRVTVWDLTSGPGSTPAATYDISTRIRLISGRDTRGRRAALRRWLIRAANA